MAEDIKLSNQPGDVLKPTPPFVPDKKQRPSLGRVVIYKLSDNDLTVSPITNNNATTCVATIVRVWDDSKVNLRLMTDASGELPWKTSIEFGDGPGQWSWPPFVASVQTTTLPIPPVPTTK